MKKSACGKTVGGIVLVKMTSNIKELLKLSIRVDLGTVKGVWGGISKTENNDWGMADSVRWFWGPII